MPGHVLHIEIASRLRHLLPKGDDVVEALYCGALAPDMGMLPGSDRLFTDLAHYLKTGELARCLVSKANSAIETAYAWGWVTHVLADAGLHPAINRASGDHSWAESPTSHMRVEFGLDFQRLGDQPSLGGARVRSTPGPSLLASAYMEVYGLQVDERVVARSHRVLSGAQRLLFRFGKRLGSSRPVRLAAGLVPNSIVAAAADPMSPTQALLEEVDSFLDSFAARFEELLDDNFDALHDFNLDTGDVAGGSDDYPLAVATRDHLQKKLSAQRPETSGSS